MVLAQVISKLQHNILSNAFDLLLLAFRVCNPGHTMFPEASLGKRLVFTAVLFFWSFPSAGCKPPQLPRSFQEFIELQ